MTTRGGPWPGAALGHGLGLVLLTGSLLTGCGRIDAHDGAAGGARASGSASPPPATPPEGLRAHVVAYWSREVLDADTYGDYQSMGLSNGQYEILRHVVDAARAEQKRSGRKAAQESIDRRAREGWYRDGGPAKGTWQ